MKPKNLKFSKAASCMLVVFMMLMVMDVAAQRYRNQAPRPEKLNEEVTERPSGFCRNLPGITPEQTEQIDALRLKGMKQTQQLRNELGEKQARLRTLSTSDKPDQNTINKTIDEIAAIKANIQKNRMATHQEIRKLLNDDQRIVFDNNSGTGRKGRGPCASRGSSGGSPGFRGDCPYRK